jgi:tRNA (mo5U34)-methyltransferase
MPQDPDLVRRIQEHPWFHSIDLGDGLVTKGDSALDSILTAPGTVPDLGGKSVLDIGAWDGKHSYRAEARGASRVVALDHYVWRLNGPARQEYYDKCMAEGILPDPDMIDNGFLMEDSLPGKKGFDMAHEYLDSKVEAVVDDFVTMDLGALGSFDVVLYFGVLYHMVDPIGALKRVRQVTNECAVIETAGVTVPGYAGSNLIYFCTGDELHSDYGNWFAPTEAALEGMCRSAGFRRVETMSDLGPQPKSGKKMPRDGNQPIHCRLVARAYV